MTEMSGSEIIHRHLQKITGAIDCLVERGFVEAALMLTYAGIDQLAWLSVATQGSDRIDFKAWVEKYLSPSTKLGCSADDLWAARNGLIHMSAAESRDFYKANAKRIYYVSGNVICTENKSQDTVIINSTVLMVAFIKGALKFISDLEGNSQNLAVAAQKAETILASRAAL